MALLLDPNSSVNKSFRIGKNPSCRSEMDFFPQECGRIDQLHSVARHLHGASSGFCSFWMIGELYAPASFLVGLVSCKLAVFAGSITGSKPDDSRY
jgi:hypothetical protein